MLFVCTAGGLSQPACRVAVPEKAVSGSGQNRSMTLRRYSTGRSSSNARCAATLFDQFGRHERRLRAVTVVVRTPNRLDVESAGDRDRTVR